MLDLSAFVVIFICLLGLGLLVLMPVLMLLGLVCFGRCCCRYNSCWGRVRLGLFWPGRERRLCWWGQAVRVAAGTAKTTAADDAKTAETGVCNGTAVAGWSWSLGPLL